MWSCQLRYQRGDFELCVEIDGAAGVVGLIGPNGAGKSTLLRILAGDVIPAHGHLQVGEEVLLDTRRGLIHRPEQRRLGYMPQGYGLFPHLRVIDNVAFGLLAQTPRLSKQARREAASKQLEAWDIAHLAQRWPSALSGGEAQRVALARALMIQPSLLLLDEPLAALDIVARHKLRLFLQQRFQQLQTPVLLVTHEPQDVWALCQQVYVLEQGCILQSGSPTALAHQPASEFVEAFLAPFERAPG